MLTKFGLSKLGISFAAEKWDLPVEKLNWWHLKFWRIKLFPCLSVSICVEFVKTLCLLGFTCTMDGHCQQKCQSRGGW